ncbi:MAG: site-2 protease family protein [Anaerolineaceae bacterium]|nr:site-2 protease family protein [Anaerolineaceae bacterium]
MVTFLITLLELVLIMGLMVLVHELGHFFAARFVKVPVEEFGIGYPPKIAKLFTWKGTEFTLNAIPFGGFVRPKGEDDPEVLDGLAAAAPWKRLLVLVAGAVMNIIIGIFFLSLLFVQTGGPDVSSVQLYTVSENSPAEAAGLMEADLILAINDVPVRSLNHLSQMVTDQIGNEIKIDYQRGDDQFSTYAIPRVNPPEGEGALGIGMFNPYVDYSYWQAVKFSVRSVWEMVTFMFKVPGMLISGEISGAEARIVGPIGIGQMLGDAREADVEAQQQGSTDVFAANTLSMIAIISVTLGVTNLLPLPALDGGRILFVIFELIFRKRVPSNLETAVHAIGFILLMIAAVLVTLNDIINPLQLP